ncbi:UNVERIFIED_CONTAM: hypothetical protein FKN15_055699 [Acipenser sinensis]
MRLSSSGSSVEAECSQRFLSQRWNRQQHDWAAVDPAWKQSEQPAIPESEMVQAAMRLGSSGSSVEAECSQRFLSQRWNTQRHDWAAADPAWQQSEQPAIPASETEQAVTRLIGSSGSSVAAE